MNHLAGVILCGGRSARMGQDKAQLSFRAGSRVYTMKSWMNRRWSSHLAPLVWAGPGPGCVPDHPSFQGQGPLAGIHAGLGALREQGAGPWALLLAVDMPDFEPDWVDLLWADADDPSQALQFDGAALLGALVRIDRAREVAGCLLARQERRLSELSRRLAPKLLPPPPDATPDALRSSMNRPSDFEQWLARRGFEPLSAGSSNR